MLETGKDEIFNFKRKLTPFSFNQEVADVFDDMVSRSVPIYDEIHKVILDIADRLIPNNSNITDLGCSTGSTIAILDKLFKAKNFEMSYTGIDNSAPMLEKCKSKLISNNVDNFELICDEIENATIKRSNLIIMNYTLQFIDVEMRLKILQKIYNALPSGGVFIFAEKFRVSDPLMNNLLIDLYHDFKRRNGYSALEVSQKRDALENVLIPLTPEENLDLLKQAGFRNIENLFRWYNLSLIHI